MVEVKEKKSVTARARAIRTSPRKLNLVAASIRGLKANQALNELSFSKRRVAVEVKKSGLFSPEPNIASTMMS